MTDHRSNLIDMTLQLHHEVEKAILVSDDGNSEHGVWLAKSLIEFAPKANGIVEVTLPEWLAIERGLVPGPRMRISVGALSQTGGHGDSRMPMGVELRAEEPRVTLGRSLTWSHEAQAVEVVMDAKEQRAEPADCLDIGRSRAPNDDVRCAQ